MDLINFNEVVNAISEVDSNVGFNIYRQMEFAKEYQRRNSYDYRDTYMEELTEKFALETLLIIKRDQRELAYNKADDLFAKWQAIPEENTAENNAAYDRYSDAIDSAIDFNTEVEDIKAHLDACFASAMSH